MVKQAVVIHDNDNVATAAADLKSGTCVSLLVGEKKADIVLNDDISFGHKFAIKDISSQQQVIKYNESIGRAIKEIKAGDHVHVHNVESERGRGDWKNT